MKVLIVDDHAIVRQGLMRLLELDGTSSGEADSAEQALVELRRERWDLLILDIAMPGRSGLDVLRDVKKEFPRLPVLVLSMYSEEHLGKRALLAGASGYVWKGGAIEELRSAVRKVMAGGMYVSPALAELLAIAFANRREGLPHERLSNREFEVLGMIASGKKLSQIAEDLHLSVSTVSTHRSHVLEKIAVESNAQLIRYAIENHLI